MIKENFSVCPDNLSSVSIFKQNQHWQYKPYKFCKDNLQVSISLKPLKNCLNQGYPYKYLIIHPGYLDLKVMYFKSFIDWLNKGLYDEEQTCKENFEQKGTMHWSFGYPKNNFHPCAVWIVYSCSLLFS